MNFEKLLQMVRTNFFLAAFLAVLLWPVAADATVWRAVNCASGGNIQSRMNAAVTAAAQGEAVIINLVSDCQQDVTIIGNDVTLRTKPGRSNARIKGTVTVDGAQRFLIESLRLSGKSYGIDVKNSASGTITDIRADGNERSGIRASLGANVTITDSKIDNNGRKFPAQDAGIEVLDSANVLSSRNLIEKNAFAAVTVTSNGIFRNGQRLDPDDKQTSKDRDIYAQLGCQDGAKPGCGRDTGAVIYVDIKGLVELHNARVTGRLQVSGLSNLEMTASRMFGDVTGEGNSGISISTTVTGQGQLSCGNNAFSYGDQIYSCGSKFNGQGNIP